MQTVGDILNMPIRVARSEQACALGAAMFAAVVAGIYPDVGTEQKAMGSGFEKEYLPIKENVVKYHGLYESYSKTANFVEKEMTR